MKWLVRGLVIAFLAGIGLASPAAAQLKTTGQIQRDIDAAKAKLDALNQQIGTKTQAMAQSAKQAVTPADPTTALPCMDISVLTKLTPQNLVPTIKGCEQDGIKQLVSDSSRALASAIAYVGPNGGSPGDSDGIACHKPALALFQAALNIPATPGSAAVDAVAAVLNPDGSIKTPAVTAAAAVAPTPEIIPGPILLYQKFGEFVMAGGLTSCPTWFNKPINAVGAAGVAGVGAVAGAALLAPK